MPKNGDTGRASANDSQFRFPASLKNSSSETAPTAGTIPSTRPPTARAVIHLFICLHPLGRSGHHLVTQVRLVHVALGRIDRAGEDDPALLQHLAPVRPADEARRELVDDD